MSPDEARAKALSVLRDGRLRLMTVKTDPAGHLVFADAIVYGHRGEHFVSYQHTPTADSAHGTWHCSCPDAITAPPCPHIFACEMVCHGVMPPGRDGAPKAKPERRPKATTS